MKSLASPHDPTLIREEKSLVALPFGEPLTNYGDPIESPFAEVAHAITSIDIYSSSFLLEPSVLLPITVLSYRS